MEENIIAADPARERGEALARKLAGYPGPVYRKAYLARLLRSGIDSLDSGNTRTAEYCFGKVESELSESEAASAPASASPASPASGPSAPGSEAGVPPRQALERVRVRWREERLRRAESVLERHGSRLSSLERKVYRDKLAKWSAPAGAGIRPENRGSENRADSALLELRRRLYGRILKIQKADLARRRGSAGPALVPVREQFAGPIGPYNDRHNLEGVIALLSQADPAWVEEFLELYRELAGLKGMMPAASGG